MTTKHGHYATCHNPATLCKQAEHGGQVTPGSQHYSAGSFFGRRPIEDPAVGNHEISKLGVRISNMANTQAIEGYLVVRIASERAFDDIRGRSSRHSPNDVGRPPFTF